MKLRFLMHQIIKKYMAGEWSRVSSNHDFMKRLIPSTIHTCICLSVHLSTHPFFHLFIHSSILSFQRYYSFIYNLPSILLFIHFIIFFLCRTPPVTFENKFLEAYPDLHERLSKAPPGMDCLFNLWCPMLPKIQIASSCIEFHSC